MRLEVLAIGDELLDGRVTDTNTLRLAQALSALGIKLAQRTTVADDKDAIIREANAIASRGAELCVVSGGLGPTADDVTAQSFAQLIGGALVRDEEQVARITKRLEKLGRGITENQFRQADRPFGAKVIANHHGTAPGFEVSFGNCRFIAVPGVPVEFDAMVEKAVIAPLLGKYQAGHCTILRSFGLVEAEVDERLASFSERWPTVRLGYRAHFPEIHISLKASAEETEKLQEAVLFVKTALGEAVFCDKSGPFAQSLVEILAKKRLTLGTAESCTGGLVGDLITDVPECSSVYKGSLVAYSNDCKRGILGVQDTTLLQHGAVSEQVVREMAMGVRNWSGSDIGVAISGIAGPGGGSDRKPVGTIWIAVAASNYCQTRKLSLPYSRRKNKVVSAYAALELVRRYLCS